MNKYFRVRRMMIYGIIITSFFVMQCGRDYPVPGSSQDNPSGTANDIFPFSQGNWAASWKNTRTINVLLPASSSERNYTADFRTQVENAIQRWNSLLANQGITLITITSGPSDIKIKWSDGSDMASGVIGFAKFSPSETDNRILVLSTQDNRNGQQHTSEEIYAITIHEFGHILGLWSHSPESNDIMYPYLTERRDLSKRDIATFQYLYALAPTIDMSAYPQNSTVESYSSFKAEDGSSDSFQILCQVNADRSAEILQ